MAWFNPLIKQALKGAKATAKRGAKGALELPRQTPPMKAKALPMAPKDELITKSANKVDMVDQEVVGTVPMKAEVKVDAEIVDKQVRASLSPDAKPQLDIQTKPDTEIISRVDAKAAKIKTDEMADNLLSKDLDQFNGNDSWQPNFDTFETQDDVKATIANMATRNKGSITEARRGVITDEQLNLLAAEMNVRGDVVRTVLERKGGEALNAETIIATRQFLNRSGSRITEMARKVTEGTADDRLKVTFRRQIELHREVMEEFMGSRAETGRTLRAFGIKIGDDSEQLKLMREVMESAHGQDIDALAMGLSKVDSMEGINKVVNEYAKSKIEGVAEELFIGSILSGVKTQVVNITGNALMPIKGLVETSIAAQMGRFTSGTDKVLIGEAQAQIFGYVSAFNDGLRMAGKAFKSGVSSDAAYKFETQYPRAISSENLDLGGSLLRAADFFNITLPNGMLKGVDRATDAIGTAVRFPMERMLSPMDEFFKTMARRGDIARSAYRNASFQRQASEMTDDEFVNVMREFIENPPKQALKEADDMALYMTFQTPLGEQGQRLQTVVNRTTGLKFLAPFMRTPTNIFKIAFGESTPLGLASPAFKMRQDLAAGGARRHIALARLSMGTGFSLSAGLATASGRLTGGGPSDYKARSALMATGWRPYSVKVENPSTGEIEYHSYARMEPLAFVIGTIADFTEMAQWSDFENEEGQADQDELAATIVAAIAQNTMSKTFVRGMSDFAEAMNDPRRYLGSWLEGMGEAMIPFSALRRDLTRIQDPTIRAAWEFSDKLRINSGIAGWADNAPPKRDLYGGTLKHHQGDLLGVVSPFPKSVETKDKTKLEIARVMQSTHKVPITMPAKRINGVKMNVHEYDRLTVLSRLELTDGAGRTFKDVLDETLESELYADATEDSKVDLIKVIQRGFDKAAKAALLEENDELAQKVYKRRVNQTIDKLGKDRTMDILGGLE